MFYSDRGAKTGVPRLTREAIQALAGSGRSTSASGASSSRGRRRPGSGSRCSRAGVSSASVIVLHVRPSIRGHLMPWLKDAYPWLYPRYVELYGRRAYAPKAYQTEVSERFARLRLRHGIGIHPRSNPAAKPHRQLALAV